MKLLNSRSYLWFWSNFWRNSWKHTGAAELDSCWMRMGRWCGSLRTTRQWRHFPLVLSASLLLFKLSWLAALQCTAFWHLGQVRLTHWNCLVTSCRNAGPRRSCLWDWRTVTGRCQPQRCVKQRYCIFYRFVIDWDTSTWWRQCWHFRCW